MGNLTEAPKREPVAAPAIVLLQNGHPELAIPMLDESLSKDPENWQLHVNIGIAYRLTDKFLLALLHQKLATQLKPDSPQAWHNLGITYTEIGDFNQAFIACHKAYELAPHHQQVCLAMAYALMREGKFESAWPLWEEARFQKSFFPVPGIKQWTGAEDINGKKILVTKEGGYGDSILFLRWCSFLMDRGARVYFQVWDKQAGIFQGHPWITEVIPTSVAINPKDFDYCVSIMSLPSLLAQKPDEIPCAEHYIEGRPADIELFRPFLHRNGKPLVGICWGAEEQGVAKRGRTIKDEEINALRDCPVEWVSLWPRHGMPWMREFELRNWSDTAALVHHLDAVVSVDTALAHLAGSMGKPTTVIIPVGADWKWFRGHDDKPSPWYPSMKIIRNEDPVSFAGAIDRVKKELS